MYIVKDEVDFDQILKENKSVFIDFYADWCGPCKMVGPVVDKISDTVASVKFVKVNVDDFPEIAQRYGIMSIPTLIAFKNGQPVDQILGFHPEAELRALIAKIA